jgi:hypothetical protein
MDLGAENVWKMAAGLPGSSIEAAQASIKAASLAAPPTSHEMDSDFGFGALGAVLEGHAP